MIEREGVRGRREHVCAIEIERVRREYVSTVEREGKREGVSREYVTTIEREGESEKRVR